jgi:hypothetical protein
MILTILGVWFVFGLLFGLLAQRKNRNPYAWGILCGFPIMFVGPILGAIALAFVPYLCPKCQKPMATRQWKQGKCPHCEWQRP